MVLKKTKRARKVKRVKAASKKKSAPASSPSATSELNFESYNLDNFAAESAGRNASTYRVLIQGIFDDADISNEALTALFICCSAASTKSRILESARNLLFEREDSNYYKEIETIIDSTTWSIMARIPKSACTVLLSVSGASGIFIEPRDDRSPDPRFGVIWLPGASLSEILCKRSSVKGALGLARFGSKIGLRFLATDLPDAHKLLRPGEDFVPLDIQEIYHLYPLPFGTQRAGLQKALNQWKWRAKPLQPVRSDSHGLCWQVGAVSKPPREILTLSTGDVLVSFSHAAKAPPSAAPLLASTRTNQLLRSQIHTPPGLAQDPWALGEDPWAAAAQHSSTAAPSGKWQQLSLELKQVQSSLHQQSAAHLDQHMADDSEDRLSKLEVDMREIKEQNHKFESWFQDAAQSNQEANHKLHMVANQVASHQTQLSNLEQAVTQNSTTLQAVNSELREEMSRGFGNIEALLNKKLRSS
ncbi:unnamed protein product [Effrenium voratum]|nr:unnamed protein product [Effrenium voratum]